MDAAIEGCHERRLPPIDGVFAEENDLAWSRREMRRHFDDCS
jgi:hypothetical protein